MSASTPKGGYSWLFNLFLLVLSMPCQSVDGQLDLQESTLALRKHQKNSIFHTAQALHIENVHFLGEHKETRHTDMDCGSWPEDITLQRLKSILGSSVYYNLAIACDIDRTVKIVDTLKLSRYNASVLELPRVNLLLSADLVKVLGTELQENTSLIHDVIIFTPDTAEPSQAAECRECCSPGNITVLRPKISSSQEVGFLSGACALERTSNYKLTALDALHGVHLKIGTIYYFPFVMEYEVDGVLQMGGFCGEILKDLVQRLNFTYTIIRTVDGNYGHADPKTNKWNGLIGMSLRKEIDIVLTGLTISRQRLQVLDFAHPFWVEPTAVLIKAIQHDESHALKPSHWKLWLAVVSSVIVTAIVSWLFEILRVDGPGDGRANVYANDLSIESFSRISLAVIATSMLKGVDRLVVGRSACIMWVSIWLVSVVIVTAYTGDLVSVLATTGAQLPFNNLEELAEDTRYKLSVTEGGVHRSLLEDARETVFAKLWQKVLAKNALVNDTDYTLMQLNKTAELRAHMADRTGMEQYMYLQDTCGWMIIPEEFFLSGLGIPFPKGSPYVDLFSNELIRMGEHGFFNRWKGKHFLHSTCGKKQYATSAILMSHILLLIQITGGCLGVTTLIFCAEVLVAYIRRARNETDKA